MKKLFAIAIAMSLAGTAMASSVGFEFGTNFFRPSVTGAQTQNGENFTVGWNLDSDVSLGIYNELSNVLVAGTAGTLAVSAIEVSKGVMKNVGIGLRLGQGTTAGAIGADVDPLADIVGAVDILSGSGDKISGSLRATVAARFCNTAASVVMDGVNLGLSVKIGF
jgi:hypothetical protein